MKSDDLYPAARALAAVRYGGGVKLEGLSVEEEIGFLMLALAVRGLGGFCGR